MLFCLLLPAVPALAQDEASEPTTPAFFELVEETGDNDTWGIVTTDPRFSGTMVEGEPVIYGETPVTPDAPGIHAIGHGYDHIGWGLSRLENDEGAWQGWSSGFSWMSGARGTSSTGSSARGHMRG